MRVGWREQGEGHTPEDDGACKAATTLQGFSAQENEAFFGPKQKNERTVILKADDQTIIFNLGRDGKLQARTSSWEDPKVFRDGDRLESTLQHGHGC